MLQGAGASFSRDRGFSCLSPLLALPVVPWLGILHQTQGHETLLYVYSKNFTVLALEFGLLMHYHICYEIREITLRFLFNVAILFFFFQ